MPLSSVLFARRLHAPFPGRQEPRENLGPRHSARQRLARAPILAHPIISPAEPRIHATATRSMLEKRHPPALKKQSGPPLLCGALVAGSNVPDRH